MPITVNCDWCGKPTRKCASDMSKTEHHFCSRKCFAHWLSRFNRGESHPSFSKTKRICGHCGKEFLVPPHVIKHGWGRFCSQKCHYEHGHVWLVCCHCGKEYSATKNQINRYGSRFCSRACKGAWLSEHPPDHLPPIMLGVNHPNWRGGYEPYYGPNWHEQRRKARKRDKVCQHCGKTPNEFHVGRITSPGCSSNHFQ